ncbi:hypothetical protein AGNV_089 [Anticarsia gemmatalis multiple nucleopolyhedrovirus]|uniref:Uncharacterized protein n=1 Tax=Anticarsia gemmatalis multiple nucleopolyhedrovirus TaxID=268591 RepID=A0A0S3IZY9_9ABAC|nr:hypothetical protein AGNV_089 [Anticarsia gemmatalis multiple nucleopolyhedrovirus]ALR71623.1 hypothetical protein AGNV_089 [Anticarsia gemmatalis multiple nucleopolyhedrovirus]
MTSCENPISTTVKDARPDQKTVHGAAEEYTVDGLKLKPAYVEYYKQLQAIVDFSVMTLSKQLNMKDYDEVYSLGRQLYEIMRGLFVDEPFKLWLEANAAQLATDKAFRDNIYKILEEQLQATVTITQSNTFKNAIINVLNNELSDDAVKYDTSCGYVKPNCIVSTFNCCTLSFKPPQ